ncbi:MAG: TlpA disulfide reductase family protein [Bacteroidia bacterium]
MLTYTNSVLPADISEEFLSSSIRSADEAGLHRAIRESVRPYVLVNFWATFCKPCKAEIPDLVKVQKDSALGMEVLLVSLDDIEEGTTESLGQALQPLGVDFESLHLMPEEAYRFIQGHFPGWNSTIPLNFIFTSDGRLVTQTGLTDYSELRMIVDEDRRFR